ncbi:MAG: SDR family NAD(P)-dependent oxidoreductase [Deltaproteobacteria bacterium]|nr:SDR family NAD(P)-dependent oxidoreductase [Deltaproteobacteria bacterium]
MDDWTTERMVSMDGKVVIVTGGNSGLGYESVAALGAAGAEVVMASRDARKATAACEQILSRCPDARIRTMIVDLSNLDSVRSFAADFSAKYGRLDVLINNASVMAIAQDRTADGFEAQFGTNYLGHFALTGRLLEVLLATAASRVVSVTSLAARSGTIRFDDLMWREGYNPWLVYAQSKLATMLFAMELQRRLEKAAMGSKSILAHPGFSATQRPSGSAVGSGIFDAIVERIRLRLCQANGMGAFPQLYAATAPELSGGEYVVPRGLGEMRGLPGLAKLPKSGRNAGAARRLWEISADLTGIDFRPL